MVFEPSGESSGRQSPGSELARLRFEHRAERLRLVVAVLRERTRLATGTAGVPCGLQRGLQQAIAGFEKVADRSGERRARLSGRIRS